MGLVHREVRRNSPEKIYMAVCAPHESDTRRAGARKFCKPLTWLSHHLVIWLKHGMNPGQIAHRLKQERPDQTVSHEWICRFIASDQRGGGELYTYFRHRRKRYRKRYGSHDRRGQLRSRVSITERSAEVNA